MKYLGILLLSALPVSAVADGVCPVPMMDGYTCATVTTGAATFAGSTIYTAKKYMQEMDIEQFPRINDAKRSVNVYLDGSSGTGRDLSTLRNHANTLADGDRVLIYYQLPAEQTRLRYIAELDTLLEELKGKPWSTPDAQTKWKIEKIATERADILAGKRGVPPMIFTEIVDEGMSTAQVATKAIEYKLNEGAKITRIDRVPFEYTRRGLPKIRARMRGGAIGIVAGAVLAFEEISIGKLADKIRGSPYPPPRNWRY